MSTYKVSLSSHQDAIHAQATSPFSAAVDVVSYMRQLGHSGNFHQISVSKCEAKAGLGVLVPDGKADRFASIEGRVRAA
jgi:hypothetical protein